jgi:predicted metalloprotease with PDZ domain
MKKILLLFLVSCYNFLSADENYYYSVNLTSVKNDKLLVELTPPTIKETEIEFCFPAMVPGTYEVYDFGKFITNFKVKGKNNTTITVTKLDDNRYKLSPANQIEKISYEVDDTFDKIGNSNVDKKVVFEPGGSNFEDGKNFSINTHNLFGYFKNYIKANFVLEFTKPKGFYPSTGLSNLKIGELKDVITVFNYNDLVDSPIMYTLPDTTSIQVANTQVLVSVYSPNKKITSKFIANTLTELLNVQRQYLGGTLSVNKYAFLFYFTSKETLSGASGALEHSYSSFYVLYEDDSTAIKQEIRDVAAHEFFHIVTPLNIHATQIGEFDFNNPTMSEHLWLYEGMTEYAAHHAQCKGGLATVDDLLNTMMEKYNNSLVAFNDTMSFTWMSKNVLSEKVHGQYSNVYEKGAVIGMCLDILLRELSSGKYGTQELMKDLSLKYGKNKSFNDADLFKEIEQMTYPEVGEFLRIHVGGKQPLPMKEILSKIGVEFIKEAKSKEITMGGVDYGFNQSTLRLVVYNTRQMDEFGKKLKFKEGDEISKVNGKVVDMNSIKEVFTNYYNQTKEGDLVTFEVERPKRRKGKYKTKTLQAKAMKVDVVQKNKIKVLDQLTDKQKLTLKSWAGL